MLGQVFSDSPFLIVLLDRRGGIVDANVAARRLLGDEVIGREFVDTLDPFSREKGSLLLTNTWDEGNVIDWEVNHVAANSEPVLVSYTTSVLYDVERIVAFGRDQTEKLEFTRQLAKTNQELEGALLALERTHAELARTQSQLVQSEKIRSLGQLVAGVAHEINNPISFVSSNLTHLSRLVPALESLIVAYSALRPLAPPAELASIVAAEEAADSAHLWDDLPDLVRESLDGTNRIRDIVLSLRNFARLDEADLKEADINDGLRSTVRLVRPTCRERISISEYYADLPATNCHPGQLNQVFLNLMTNAVQSITVTGKIEVRSRHEPGLIRVTIQDTGSGMNAETLRRIGEPFFTTKPVGSGVGLGLAVSIGIVERHKGKLRFESEPGRGTTAIVEIPIDFRSDEPARQMPA